MFRRKTSKDVAGPSPEAKRDAALLQMVSGTQAVIHFDPTGTILFANENFLAAMGYELDEIVGNKHAMFCDPEYVQTEAYAQFWQTLRSGTDHAGVFPRFVKSGEEIWIDATYAPVFDENGEVERVIKVASDATEKHKIVTLLTEGLLALRDGEFHPRHADGEGEELQKLNVTFNETVDSLANFVLAARQVSSSVKRIAGDLGSASDSLAKRTESQAASLEEIAAAIHELSSTARNSLERAKENHEIASSTQTTADDGRKVVDEVVDAMSEIEESSGQISQVLTVIDEIAFQTNLLALNAGVEAARAGEAGRGFAVVASEVRSLAQRASEAATEIKTLVQSSSDRVEKGSKLVTEAGSVLQRIFEGIGQISENVGSNLTTLDEQAHTIDEINSATTQLSQDTEQNSSSINATAQMSRGLETEVDKLVTEVSKFQVDESSSPIRAAS